MASIAEFTLPAPDFPLGALFDGRPDARFELDRVVPSGDTVMPYFWVSDQVGEMEQIRTFLDGLPELRSAELLVDLEQKGLFRAEWEPEYMGIMAAIAAAGVTVLAAHGSSDGWYFEVRATELDQLSTFRQHCLDQAIDVSLVRVSRLSAMSDDCEYGLTPEQYEALLLAFREGYYDDPRTVDQAALADQLGISRQAFAARLRRGYRALIEHTLAADMLPSQ